MAKSKSIPVAGNGADEMALRRVESIHELSVEKETYFTTLDPAIPADRSLLTSALETADVGMDAVAGEPLFIEHIVCHRVPTWNQAGTVTDDKLRVVLIDTEGRLISGLSNHLMRGAGKFISDTIGQGETLPVRVHLDKIGTKRSFRGYRFVLEGIE